jgi:hypothetical protein
MAELSSPGRARIAMGWLARIIHKMIKTKKYNITPVFVLYVHINKASFE